MFIRHPAEERLLLSLDNLDGQVVGFQRVKGELRAFEVLTKGGMGRRINAGGGSIEMKMGGERVGAGAVKGIQHQGVIRGQKENPAARNS